MRTGEEVLNLYYKHLSTSVPFDPFCLVAEKTCKVAENTHKKIHGRTENEFITDYEFLKQCKDNINST
uniref:Uncharacterized protein n=1 Tax=Anopheles atroparvus TaxID=41427 RepID=A0AAG5DUP7_ANOAO